MTQRYLLLSEASGSSYTLGEFNAPTGMARLYEGGTATYIYQVPSQLLKTTDYVTFTNVSVGQATASAVVETSSVVPALLAFWGGSDSYSTTSGSSWTSGSAMPANVYIVDAVNDSGNTFVLAGNGHVGTEARVLTAVPVAPFGFTRSDSGINTSAIITDLEASE